MLTKSRVTPARNAPFPSPGSSLGLRLEISIPSGGLVAPDSNNQMVDSSVGFHSDHRSIRPTFDPCAIAEPASLDMFLIRKYVSKFLDPTLFCNFHYSKIHSLTGEFHDEFHAKTDIERIKK